MHNDMADRFFGLCGASAILVDSYGMTAAVTWPGNLRETPSQIIARRRVGRRVVRAFTHLHEALLGRPTLAIAEQLEESQWKSREWHLAAQLGKLRALVAHGQARCPYYQHSFSGSVIRSLNDLAGLPLLTRSTLRQQFEKMAWRDSRQKLLLGHTHGTFDEPVRFYWDRSRQAWDKANRLRGHAWHGFQIGDRELHVWPIDPPKAFSSHVRQWLREMRDSLSAESQIDILSPANQSPDALIRILQSFDPVRLTAYPSALCELLLAALSRGHAIDSPTLRQVFLTGEFTFDWQRRLIESMLHVPIVQSYGLQEAGALAFACEYGRWHVSAESAIIEIVRKNRPAEPGELGEVVVTGLVSQAMPMIRYCTGDIVRAVKPVECSCGRGLPTTPPVIGRAGDFLMTSQGVWLSPADVIVAMSDVIEPGRFQMRQDTDGDVTVLVVSGECDGLSRRLSISDRVNALLGCRRCDVRVVPSCARSLYGKCRYIISELTSGGLATA